MSAVGTKLRIFFSKQVLTQPPLFHGTTPLVSQIKRPGVTCTSCRHHTPSPVQLQRLSTLRPKRLLNPSSSFCFPFFQLSPSFHHLSPECVQQPPSTVAFLQYLVIFYKCRHDCDPPCFRRSGPEALRTKTNIPRVASLACLDFASCVPTILAFSGFRGHL